MTASKTQSGSKSIRSGVLKRHLMVLTLSSALSLSPVTVSVYNYSAAQAAPVVGQSAAVQGKVFVSTQGAERKAQIKEAIKLNDVVTTKEDSALQVLLLDESTLTVGQNCVLTIDKFIYDPDAQAGEFVASVTTGAFRFVSGAIGKNNPQNASITTPTATLGIRGTFLEGVVGLDAVALAQLGGIDTSTANPQAASLIVLRGPGPNSNSLDKTGFISVSTAGGSTTVSTPNYAIFDAGDGSAPFGPFPVTEQMQEYLDFFLRSSPNGDPEDVAGVGEDISSEAGQDNFEPQVSVSQEDPFDELIEGIQDSLTEQFCSDPYGSFVC